MNVLGIPWGCPDSMGCPGMPWDALGCPGMVGCPRRIPKVDEQDLEETNLHTYIIVHTYTSTSYRACRGLGGGLRGLEGPVWAG